MKRLLIVADHSLVAHSIRLALKQTAGFHVIGVVDGRLPVLVDGGIRRGTDVAKALILGATAVLIGRPYVWGLAVHGAAGVKLVVDMLRTELEMAMGLLGAPTLANLGPDLLWDASGAPLR